MKLCLNTLIWRDRPLADALQMAGALGVTTLEPGATPECGHLDPSLDREALLQLKKTLQGFEVAAVAADHPHLARREDEGGDEAVSHTIGAVKRAGDLGARVVTVTLGATEVDAWDTAWERAFTSLRMVLYHTARSKVKVAVLISTEDVLNSVRKARRLMEAIDNPRLGLALDTGCLHYQRIQLTEALLVGGERVHHVRLRDATRTDFNRPIGEGEVNFAASVKQLRQHGYVGAISLSVSDPQSVAQSVSRIQPLLASGGTPVAADPETEPEPEE